DPFSPALFVFCNRRRDKMKILHWDHNGFWLYYRRLEKGRFQWPTTQEHGTLTVSRRQLQWLLDGLALDQRQAHRPVHARVVVCRARFRGSSTRRQEWVVKSRTP